MQLRFTKAAARQLRKLPLQAVERIESKLLAYAADPAVFANQVVAMQGEDNRYRLRVGEYRVIFDQDGVVIEIVAVGHRRDIYRKTDR
ncbi:type II toxin-antitoxin system RelE/ParE family toxin [Ferrovibrio sp.]|uniref:type II toxin-antitoxin system RelE family toxin n=1 Tax=Ferrovibrio sp. TaxID=1917215 RepID=UPI001B6CEF65|nr:type II toxin-antitoxin system RelE/ParE family toxin [Ferrovibrio sp.]MBP7063803.1 type II toxin-antitoxin system RelE/ParE family toxin [Ferrovibrio sp.]